MRNGITEQDINIIRGKLLVGHTTVEENQIFLEYVTELEVLVEEASYEDFYGSQGWRYRLGWDQ